MGRGEQRIEFGRNLDFGSGIVGVDARFAVGPSTTILPPAHPHLVQPSPEAPLHVDSVWKGDLRPLEKPVNGQRFTARFLRNESEQSIVQSAIPKNGGLCIIPAGVNGTKAGQLEI